MNGSFDEYTALDNGWQRHADGWETYPDGDHYSVHLDGETAGFLIRSSIPMMEKLV